MTTLELIERGIGHNCLSDAYDLGRADERPSAFGKGYDGGYKNGRKDAEAEHEAMCETCIHKVSADDLRAIRNSAIDEYFSRFDEFVKSNPKLTYFWTEFQVEARRIAERMKEQKNE